MNYIGSKYKLSDFLLSVIENTIGSDLSNKIFCDIFAGTGIVGRALKSRVKKIISNDLEYYSYVINKNYIGNHTKIDNIDEMIQELNKLVLIENGFIYSNYCVGGQGERQYFSDYNGKKIDTIRYQIEEWKKKSILDDNTYFFLLCSLLECADKLANTACVYGAYLKKLKKTAQENLVLSPALFEITSNDNEVYCEDANSLIEKISGDILYLDPPYNTRQYGAYYHLLNTIAEYKPFIPKGKTGMRNYNKSLYCKINTVSNSFEDLIKKAQFKYIFLSYNNEGLMSVNDIEKIMKKYGHYDLAQIDYQRYKADKTANRNHKANKTIEYVHILEKV